MKRVGVDTNVVVSFLTDRDADQQSRAAALFAAAAAGEHVIVLHQVVLAEAVYAMCNLYAAKPGAVRTAMRDLLSLPGVVAVDAIEWGAVWESWPRRTRDFADACLIAVGKSGAFDLLATFDRRFERGARGRGLGTYW